MYVHNQVSKQEQVSESVSK